MLESPSYAPISELRRPHDGRLVGGVAAGVGRHLGVDPVYVRIGFVVLTILGGSGLLLYGAAWVLVPAEGETEAPISRVLDLDQLRVATITIGVFAIAVALLVADLGLGLGSFGLLGPALLIGGGLYLLLQSERPSRRDTGERDEGSSLDESLGASGGGETDAGHVDPSGGTDTAPTLRTSPVGGDVRTDVGATPTMPRSPRERSFITPTTLSVIALLAGAAILGDKVDLIGVTIPGFLAVALGLVGVGLLVSAWWGRAPGLIPVGIVVTMALAVTTAVNLGSWHGAGERIHRPEGTADLADAYRLGAGHMVVDLRDLELAEGSRELEIELTFGQLDVYIPSGPEVVISAENRMGQLTVLGESEEGLGNDIDSVVPAEPGESGRLEVDIAVGAGSTDVRRD